MIAEGVVAPPVTSVICSVERGVQYAIIHWKEARDLHQELVALMHSVLHMVGGDRAETEMPL